MNLELETLKNQLTRSMIDRYPSRDDKKVGMPRKYYNENELFWISEKILEWFYNDELGFIIIHGQQGYGKSCYGCISCAETYGHNHDDSTFFYNWEAVKYHTVWTPRQFIDLSKQKPMDTPLYKKRPDLFKIHPSNLKKEPFVLWDDAGYWLNAMDYRDDLCIKVSKFLEVARSRWAAIVFTVSDQRQLLNKIRGIPHAWSIPIKKTGTPKRGKPKYKWVHDRRFAQLHKSWVSEDLKKSGKKGEEGDLFYARLPGNFNPYNPDWVGWHRPADKEDRRRLTWGFYGWYKPFRDKFCDIAISDMDKAERESKISKHEDTFIESIELDF